PAAVTVLHRGRRNLGTKSRTHPHELAVSASNPLRVSACIAGSQRGGSAMNARRCRSVAVLLGTALAAGVWAGVALAQGVIVDRRAAIPVGRSYEIREVGIDARVRDQVAEVQVSQTFHNPGSFQIESEFLFPLPEDGAVQNFVLLVDGRELPGRLL